MLVFDTNILLDAANVDSDFHDASRRQLDACLNDTAPVYLTWSICYEFLKASTHPRVFPSPLNVAGAWCFIETVLDSPGGGVLTATDRHPALLAQTLAEFPDLRGAVLHDVHTVVLMREHGVSRICTRDADFRRFPFLTVVDPLAERA